MYGVSAASLARQESAFLWPRPALSTRPPLFPPPLCVCISPGREKGVGGGQERRRKGVRRRKKERGSRVCLTGFSSLVCVKWKDEGGERHDVKP